MARLLLMLGTRHWSISLGRVMRILSISISILRNKGGLLGGNSWRPRLLRSGISTSVRERRLLHLHLPSMASRGPMCLSSTTERSSSRTLISPIWPSLLAGTRHRWACLSLMEWQVKCSSTNSVLGWTWTTGWTWPTTKTTWSWPTTTTGTKCTKSGLWSSTSKESRPTLWICNILLISGLRTTSKAWPTSPPGTDRISSSSLKSMVPQFQSRKCSSVAVRSRWSGGTYSSSPGTTSSTSSAGNWLALGGPSRLPSSPTKHTPPTNTYCPLTPPSFSPTTWSSTDLKIYISALPTWSPPSSSWPTAQTCSWSE